MDQVSELEAEIKNIQKYHYSQRERLSNVCRQRNVLEVELKTVKQHAAVLRARAQRVDGLEAQIAATNALYHACLASFRATEEKLFATRTELVTIRRLQHAYVVEHRSQRSTLLTLLLSMTVAFGIVYG